MPRREPAALPRAARPRAVLYLRQSTYREESISLELQETAGREYCARHGYEVVGVESDPGISGRTWARPAVQRVMDMVERHEIDVVVLWKWSRLSRKRLDWAVALDKVESAGGRIESATEPADTTTSAGRFQRGVLAEVAAMESERIGEQWKETLQRRLRNGLPGSGGARYGYDKIDGAYVIRDDQAAVLLEAYQHYVRDEWGWSRLTRWLNEAGHRTITGSLWAPDKIRTLLDAGFGAGQLATGYRTGTITYYEGKQPPIIDAELWQAYRDRRAQAPRPPRQVEATTPLAGLLRCGDCGGPMRSITRSAGVKGYGCGNYLRFKMGRYVTCTRAAAETFVRGWLAGYAERIEEAAELAKSEQRPAAAPINTAAALDLKLATKTNALGAMTADHYSGSLSAVEYEAGRAAILSEIASLEAQKRTLRVSESRRVDVRELTMQLDAYWDRLTPHAARTMLSTVLSHVEVVPPAVRKNGGAGPVTYRAHAAWDPEVVSE